MEKGKKNLCRVYLRQKTITHAITLGHSPGPQNIWVNNSCPYTGCCSFLGFWGDWFFIETSLVYPEKFFSLPLPTCDSATPCPKMSKFCQDRHSDLWHNREYLKPMCLVWRGHGSRLREYVMGPCSAGLAPRLGRLAFSRARLPELSKDSAEQSHPCSYQVSVFWRVMVLLIQGSWQEHLACLPVWY